MAPEGAKRDSMPKTFGQRCAMAGFTLLELVFAVILAVVLTRYAMMKLVTPGTMTLPAQAESVAASIRRAQGLAVERGQRMSFSVAASGADYRVTLVCAASGPCSTDQTYLLPKGMKITAAAPVYFNSLGQPVVSASASAAAATASSPFSMSFGSGITGEARTITVWPVTGRVTVDRPRPP